MTTLRPHCTGCNCERKPIKVQITVGATPLSDRLLDAIRQAVRERPGDWPGLASP